MSRSRDDGQAVDHGGGGWERLRTTPRHVRRLVFERRIAYRKVGRFVRFHPDDLAEYIAAHRIEVTRMAASGGLRAISGGR